MTTSRSTDDEEAKRKLIESLPLTSWAKEWETNAEKNSVIALINNSLPQGYCAKTLGNGNNLNIAIEPIPTEKSPSSAEEKMASLVVQFTRDYESHHLNAMMALKDKPLIANTHWCNQDITKLNQSASDNETRLVQVFDRYDMSLTKAAELIPDDKKINFITSVTKELSNYLSALKSNDILNTDFKADNFLIKFEPKNQGDDKININNFTLGTTDFKGCITGKDYQRLTQNESPGDFINATSAYLSRHLLDYGFDSVNKNNAANEWNKENAYQLAITIHKMATGTDKCNDSIKGEDYDQKFNFNHPIFQTKAGKELENIINSLAEKRPDERMTHEVASKNLEKLTSGVEKLPEKERTRSDTTAETTSNINPSDNERPRSISNLETPAAIKKVFFQEGKPDTNPDTNTENTEHRRAERGSVDTREFRKRMEGADTKFGAFHVSKANTESRENTASKGNDENDRPTMRGPK